MENGKVNEIKKNKVQQMRENLCEAFLKKRRKNSCKLHSLLKLTNWDATIRTRKYIRIS